MLQTGETTATRASASPFYIMVYVNLTSVRRDDPYGMPPSDDEEDQEDQEGAEEEAPSA